jgi:hypothetical protein
MSVLVWSYFRLPEPKGLFSARKFRSVEIDPFRSEHLEVVPFNDSTEKSF